MKIEVYLNERKWDGTNILTQIKENISKHRKRGRIPIVERNVEINYEKGECQWEREKEGEGDYKIKDEYKEGVDITQIL